MSKGEVSELLKPRWKLINDFPGCNKDAMWYGESFAIHGKIYHSKDYPGILRPMAWYEEREASEMPEYVKYTDANGTVIEVCEVITYEAKENNYLDSFISNYDKTSIGTISSWLRGYVPATETEYNQYISKTQTQEK